MASSVKQQMSLQPATLFYKRLQHRCFPVNVVKLLIIIFEQNAWDPLHPYQNFDPHHSCFWTHTLHTTHEPMHPHTLAPMPPTLFSRIRNSPNLWGYFYSFKEVIFVWGVSTPLYAMDIFSILLSDFNSTPVLPANILGSFSCWTIFLWLFFLTSQNFHGFAHLVLKNEVSLIRSRARLTDIIFVFFGIFLCGCSGGVGRVVVLA